MSEFFDPEILLMLERENQVLKQHSYVPKRIQGTDGVRGKIAFNSQDPLYDYAVKNLISPEFIELYVYSWGRLLLEDGAKLEDKVVLAQDPRDKSGAFLKAATTGLSKAGLSALYIGCLPTPAVPFYILKKETAGGIMLSASHNPADEHGIKIFDHRGLKYLPDYDERLTAIIKTLDYEFLNGLPTNEKIVDEQTAAKKQFIDFCLARWRKFAINKNLLQNTTLVLDLSNGAMSTVATEIFNQLAPKALHITNNDLTALINENCGVTDFEGVNIITKTDWQDSAQNWRQHETINRIFELAATKDENLIGLIFDGDGDRLLTLEYQPQQKAILIHGGDYIAARLARYYQHKNSQNILINTIESDHSIDTYVRSLGWQTYKKSVGDKWFASAILELNKDLSDQVFIFGYEESGHFVFLEKLSSAATSPKPLLAGNGILAALRFLATTEEPLKIDYTPGKRFTLSIYYINKNILINPDFHREVQALVAKKISASDDLDCRFKLFKYEKDLVYFEVHHATKKQIGSIFIRNSGTENKASINVRCETSASATLSSIATEIYCYLWFKLKDFNQAENALILKILHNTQNIDELAKKYPKIFPKVRKVLASKERLLAGKTLSDLGSMIKNLITAQGAPNP